MWLFPSLSRPDCACFHSRNDFLKSPGKRGLWWLQAWELWLLFDLLSGLLKSLGLGHLFQLEGEVIMEPGTLDAIFAYLQECRKSASLSKGSLVQPEGLFPQSRHGAPPAPLRLFPGWCTKATQTPSSDQSFPSLEFWWQYQLREIPPLSAPGWFFLLHTSVLWF